MKFPKQAVIPLLLGAGLIATLLNQSKFSDLGSALANSQNKPVNGSMSEEITIARVKDGDTVKLSDGRDARFCGIDAPETGKRDKPGQPGGEESKKYLEALVQKANGKGSIVVTDIDKYGRTVAEITLRIPDYPSGEVNVNSEMIASGNAGLFHSKFRHFVHLRERIVPGIRDFRLRWLKPLKLVT
ncbi:MAG: thermonuclease family protein [Cyanobacteria bacterium]|nr:thermonuclease family protein [Cyanobacteriota bacterium]